MMDLFSLSATSSPVATTSSRDAGQWPVDTSTRPPDASSSPEGSFSGSLFGFGEQAKADAPMEVSPVGTPLPIVTPGVFLFPSQESLVQATTQETPNPTEAVTSEEGPVDILGADGSISDARAWTGHSSPRGPIPSLGGNQPSETGQDRLTENAIQASSEPVSGARGTFRFFGPGQQNIESQGLVREGDSSVPNFVGKEGHTLSSESTLRSPEVQDETAEGVDLSKEGCRTKGDAPDAGPRLHFSRLETAKAAGAPTEQQLGELRTMGRPGPGETDASLSGKDGVPCKQDCPVEVPSRAPASQTPSTQQAPAHPMQPPTNGSLQVFRNVVHLQIHDEELGPMRWHVQLNGEKITAEAVVETTRVQELMRMHQDLLESKLNALGVEVEDFDVSVDQGTNRYSALLEGKEFRPSERSCKDTLCPGDTEPSALRADMARDRGLDLYV